MHGGYDAMDYRGIRNGDAGKLGDFPILSALPDKFARFLCEDSVFIAIRFPRKQFLRFYGSHRMDLVLIRPPGILAGAFIVSPNSFLYAQVLLLFSTTVATDTGSKSFDCALVSKLETYDDPENGIISLIVISVIVVVVVVILCAQYDYCTFCKHFFCFTEWVNSLGSMGARMVP
jgi:hypothetical protein